MSYNCPVCNNAGLPNYKEIATICPICDSDLKPFLILSSIGNKKSSAFFIYCFLGFSIVSVVFMFLYFSLLSSNKKLEIDSSNRIRVMQDSLLALQSTIAHTQTEVDKKEFEEQEIILVYVVKSGDNTSKIARFFYNDFRMYTQIEADNNLKAPYFLQVGQKLNIKIKMQ
jgi:hypothetical protein